ncbi:DUF4097 domain-containing protein [Leucobacter insecticola]|uniref:DUF4097 domain-containing protein n=1 Tax=Leucobacter insecticola TaxID=2714934 RepID=A0A6G8FJK9_9MICO|nr:DUF4097 family beta strand repeat-containing protein [Leucobacter insecticola]QIM16469.1 DUF4097 domain-containing protein [Leucobacter insecticola]
MKTFETPRPVTAVIHMATKSNILVIAEERGDTTVEVTPKTLRRGVEQRLKDHLTVSFTNGLLEVTFRPPLRTSWFDFATAVDVTVRLPLGSKLRATTGMGHLRCEGIFDEVELKSGQGEIWVDRCVSLRSRTGNGDCHIGRVTERIDVATGNGTLRLGSLNGDGSVSSAHGDVFVSDISGRVRLKSAHGDMVVRQSCGEVDLKTSHGNLRVEDAIRGSVSLRTASGSVGVGVREGTAAWLDLNSASGRIRNDLGPAAGPSEAQETLEVVARTGNGDVVIRRAAGPEAAAA